MFKFRFYAYFIVLDVNCKEHLIREYVLDVIESFRHTGKKHGVREIHRGRKNCSLIVKIVYEYSIVCT